MASRAQRHGQGLPASRRPSAKWHGQAMAVRWCHRQAGVIASCTGPAWRRAVGVGQPGPAAPADLRAGPRAPAARAAARSSERISTRWPTRWPPSSKARARWIFRRRDQRGRAAPGRRGAGHHTGRRCGIGEDGRRPTASRRDGTSRPDRRLGVHCRKLHRRVHAIWASRPRGRNARPVGRSPRRCPRPARSAATQARRGPSSTGAGLTGQRWATGG